MSEELQQDGGAAAGDSGSFLDRAISATSQTAPDRTKELLIFNQRSNVWHGNMG